MFYDTHAHYDDERFSGDLDHLMVKMYLSGVNRIINVPRGIDTNFIMREKFSKFHWVKYAVGWNSNFVDFPANILEKEKIRKVRELLADPDSYAVKTSLDWYRDADRDWQIWAFKELLGWAVEAEKPLIIHGRAAYEDVLKIYDEEMRSVSAKPGGVIHCFDGDFETALEFIDRGFYLEIGGQVTKLPALQETVARLPLERIVLETDAPYLTPKGCEGVNHSLNLPLICGKVAELLGQEPKKVEEVTYRNAEQLYRNPAPVRNIDLEELETLGNPFKNQSRTEVIEKMLKKSDQSEE